MGRDSLVGIATRYKPDDGGIEADPSARAVYGEGLRPIACWDCEFESRRGHGCLCCVLYSKDKRQDNKDKETVTDQVQSTRE